MADQSPPLPLQTGKPPRNGVYVAYVEHDITAMAPSLMNRIFLTYIDGTWSYPLSDMKYRGTVHGFIGPLPALLKKAHGL